VWEFDGVLVVLGRHQTESYQWQKSQRETNKMNGNIQETRQAKSVKPGNSIGRVDRGEISISEQECVACEITKPKIDERSGADRKLQVGKNKSDAWKNQSNLTAPARFRNATEETKIAAPKRTENESVRMNSDMGKNNKHPTKKQKQIFYCTLIRLQLIHRGHNSHSLIWLKIK
jgi:hypothetical protein